MTIEQLEKVSWLNRVYYADMKIKALCSQRDRLKELAECVTTNYKTNDTGTTSTIENTTESAFMKLSDINMRIDSDVQKLSEIYDEVENVINQVDDDVLQTFLKRRYLAFETIEQIAEAMNYSVRNVNYKHKQALDKIALDCIELHE